MADLIIIGRNLSRDIVKLLSILETNNGCIDEITLHCIVFLKGRDVGINYVFEWNGFIPYSRELSNKVKLLEKLGIVKRHENEICLGNVDIDKSKFQEAPYQELKELIGKPLEELVELAKNRFFRKKV